MSSKEQQILETCTEDKVTLGAEPWKVQLLIKECQGTLAEARHQKKQKSNTPIETL